MLVLTDHPDPKLILLEYHTDKGTPELTETWSSSLYDRHARHAEYLNDIIVHPAGRAAIVSCYAGKLKVVTFKNGKVDSDFDVMSVSLSASVSAGRGRLLPCRSLQHAQSNPPLCLAIAAG